MYGATLLNQIALHAVRRHVEHTTIAQRAQQLDVFPVGPDQWHCGTGWLAAKQFALRNVFGLPDLFRQQSARPRQLAKCAQQRGGMPGQPGADDADESFVMVVCSLCWLNAAQAVRANDFDLIDHRHVQSTQSFLRELL